MMTASFYDPFFLACGFWDAEIRGRITEGSHKGFSLLEHGSDTRHFCLLSYGQNESSCNAARTTVFLIPRKDPMMMTLSMQFSPIPKLSQLGSIGPKAIQQPVFQ